MTDVNYDRLYALDETGVPPRRTIAPKNTVPAINQRTIYWGGGIVGFALILMLVVRIFGGASFSGDILIIGTMGVLFCGILFCLSALGAYGLRRHQAGDSKSHPGWVAALVQDRQYDAATGDDFVFLELVDGRRVRLVPQTEEARDAKPGQVGWASYAAGKLIEFVPE